MAKLLAIFVLLVAPGVFATEATVQVTPKVAGLLNLPSEAQQHRRAVLLLHGWNSQMNEVGELYQNLAAMLADDGIASLRISFSGEGPQANYVVTSTFDSRVAEAAMAFELLKQQYPDATYGVVGFSLGGLTAMGLLDEHAEEFASVVLWSAAQQMRINGDPSYDAAARTAMREGKAVYQDFVPITITREHLASFVGVDVHYNLAKFHGSLLTIRGDNDFLPSHDRNWLATSPSLDKAFVLIGGADHIFNVLDKPQPIYPANVLDMTARWFKRTL